MIRIRHFQVDHSTTNYIVLLSPYAVEHLKELIKIALQNMTEDEFNAITLLYEEYETYANFIQNIDNICDKIIGQLFDYTSDIKLNYELIGDKYREYAPYISPDDSTICYLCDILKRTAFKDDIVELGSIYML